MSGDPYLAIRLAEMSQDVSSTKLFKQVDIKPLISQAEGNRVPVQVTLSNRVDHEIETGIGYATDVGPRLSASLGETLGEPLWSPPLQHRQDLGAGSGAQLRLPDPGGQPATGLLLPAINTPTTTTPAPDLATFGVHRWTRRPESWDRDVFVRLENEHVQGQDEGTACC